MNFKIKAFVLILLLGVAVTPSACQQVNDQKLSKDQKEILSLYASEYLFDKYQYLFHKSISEKRLLEILTPPLTPEDFKLPRIALHPDTEIQKGDTLFSKEELNSWTTQLSEYNQLKWDEDLFSDTVRFISKNEIPDYLNHTDIPPPGQDPVFIHYITQPFIYNNQSALVYARKWSSGANIRSTYLYFVKTDGQWQLKETGRNSVIY